MAGHSHRRQFSRLHLRLRRCLRGWRPLAQPQHRPPHVCRGLRRLHRVRGVAPTPASATPPAMLLRAPRRAAAGCCRTAPAAPCRLPTPPSVVPCATVPQGMSGAAMTRVRATRRTPPHLWVCPPGTVSPLPHAAWRVAPRHILGRPKCGAPMPRVPPVLLMHTVVAAAQLCHRLWRMRGPGCTCRAVCCVLRCHRMAPTVSPWDIEPHLGHLPIMRRGARRRLPRRRLLGDRCVRRCGASLPRSG